MVIPGGLQRLEDISQARLIMSQMLNPPIDVSSAYSKWTRVKLADARQPGGNRMQLHLVTPWFRELSSVPPKPVHMVEPPTTEVAGGSTGITLTLTAWSLQTNSQATCR